MNTFKTEGQRQAEAVEQLVEAFNLGPAGRDFVEQVCQMSEKDLDELHRFMDNIVKGPEDEREALPDLRTLSALQGILTERARLEMLRERNSCGRVKSFALYCLTHSVRSLF